jgi:hypothetical protein
VGAARKEISQGLLVRVLTDWDIGEVELHAVFPSRKAAKLSARALDLLPSSAVMIFPSRSQLRSEFPLGTTAMALIDLACAAATSEVGKSLPIAAKK